jgi:SPP1 gp7 family putative phage head morphogenesis protein
MASIPSVNRIIRALLEQLNVERVINADALANSLNETTREFISRIINKALSSKERFFKITEIGDVLKALPAAWATAVGTRMEKLASWASEQSAMIFTREVPRSWMAAKIREQQASSGTKETPLDKIHEMPKDEYERLVRRYVLPVRNKSDIEQTVYRPAIIVKNDGSREVFAWQDRILDLSKKVDPTRVAAKIVDAHAEGASVQELSKMLVDETAGIGASARRIARTESMRQMNDETMKRYDELGDMCAGVMYLATLDERVRPEHAILHGRIWWKNGRKPDIKEMPVPPIAANCRCNSTSVLTAPVEALNDPTYLAELRAATANSGPDITTQENWWRQTDEARKRLSVGSKRYDVVKSLLNREPQWSDFVNPDGGFLKIPQLQSETPEQRDRRRMAIQMTIADQGNAFRDVSKFGFAI